MVTGGMTVQILTHQIDWSNVVLIALTVMFWIVNWSIYYKKRLRAESEKEVVFARDFENLRDKVVSMEKKIEKQKDEFHDEVVMLHEKVDARDKDVRQMLTDLDAKIDKKLETINGHIITLISKMNGKE